MPDQSTTLNQAPTFAYSFLTGAVTASPQLPTADFGSSINVNFNGTAEFSVGGWIQFNTQTPPDGTFYIFSSNNQFAMQFVLASGSQTILQAFFWGSTAYLTNKNNPTFNLSDGNWHFIFVTYQTGSPVNTLTLYVDGLAMDYLTISTPSISAPAGDCQLAGPLSFINFQSWCIFNTSFPETVPLWGDPTSGGAGYGSLVAAWDFSNGGTADVSGNNNPITVNGTQYWTIPAVCNFSGNLGYLQPSASDELNPGGADAFSVTAWAYWSEGVSAWVIENSPQDAGTLFSLGFDNTSGTVDLSIVYGSTTVKGTALNNAWSNVAVTYDGTSTLTLYVNGVQVGQSTSAPPQSTSSPNVMIGCMGWYTQGLTVWNTCLSATDVQTYMSTSPVNVEGCVAVYPFVADMINLITGNPAVIVGEGVVLQNQVLPVADASAPPVPQDNSDESAVVKTLYPAQVLQAAAAMGIDTTAIPAVGSPGAASAADIAYLTTALAAFPEAVQQKILAQYQRNYTIGVQMFAKGNPVGSFTCKISGNQATFYYHTAKGPQAIKTVEVAPSQTLGSTLVCVATILLNGIALMLAVLGVAEVETPAMVDLCMELAGELLCLESTIGGFLQISNPTIGDDAIFVIQLIGCLGSWMFDLLWECLTGDWWSFAGTCLTVALEIGAAVASGGTLLAIRIATVGYSVYTLVQSCITPPCSGAGTTTVSTLTNNFPGYTISMQNSQGNGTNISNLAYNNTATANMPVPLFDSGCPTCQIITITNNGTASPTFNTVLRIWQAGGDVYWNPWELTPPQSATYLCPAGGTITLIINSSFEPVAG